MPELYDIRVRHTFLEFTPCEELEEGLCRSWSCPNLVLVEAEATSIPSDTENSEWLPPAPSSASTDSDGCGSCVPSPKVGTAQFEDQKCHPVTPIKVTTRRNKTALAMQMKLNKQLIVADRHSKPDVFSLIRMQLHRMNAVNLSTSIHRLVRLGGTLDQEETDVLNALLSVIEKQTRCELELHGGTMSAKCATIIAWSCASLQVYRRGLFASLIEVAQLGLETCQDFEVTNLLWACCQFLKDGGDSEARCGYHGHAGHLELAVPLCNLMAKLGPYYEGRLSSIKGQILVSALVSMATLSSVETLTEGATRVFVSICNALALKIMELSLNNKTQIGVACQIIAKHQEQVLRAVSKPVSKGCPELAAHFRV